MTNNEALLQRIYAHPEMRKIPVGYQGNCAKVVADIVEDFQKETSTAKTSKKSGEKGGAEK